MDREKEFEQNEEKEISQPDKRHIQKPTSNNILDCERMNEWLFPRIGTKERLWPFMKSMKHFFAGSNSVIKQEKKIKELKKKLKMQCYLYMVPTSPNTHAFTSLV